MATRQEETPVQEGATTQGGLESIGSAPTYKPGSGKNLGSVSVPTGGAVSEQTSSGILSNMQKMLDEYNSPSNTFMKGIDRAIAYTHYDPTAALHEVNEQEQQEQANKYTLAQNMAAIRAQGEQSNALVRLANSPANANANANTNANGEAGAVQNLTRYQQASQGAPASVKNQADLLFNSGHINDAFKVLSEYEIKGKPTDVKMAEYINTLQPGSATRALMEGQQYKDVIGAKKVKYENGQEVPYTIDPNATQPSISGMKAALQTNADTGTPAFKDPSIQITSAYRTPEKQNELYQKSVANGTPGKLPDGTPVAKPGTSAHETLPAGDVYDIDPSKLTNSGRTELAQKGYYQPYGKDSPHWQKIPPAGGQQQQGPTTLGGLNPVGTEGVKAIAGDYERSQTAFDKDIKGPLATQVASENAIPENVNRALSVLKTTNVGPGTSMNQALTEFKGALTQLTPEQIDNLNKVKTLDQVQKNLLAAGVKSAFGGNLSDKESDRYIASLYKIDDPKQFIQASLELIRANALYKQEAYRFMAAHPHNSAQEFEKWKDGGKTYSTIMQKEAPSAYALANGTLTSSASGQRKTIKLNEMKP